MINTFTHVMPEAQTEQTYDEIVRASAGYVDNVRKLEIALPSDRPGIVCLKYWATKDPRENATQVLEVDAHALVSLAKLALHAIDPSPEERILASLQRIEKRLLEEDHSSE